MSFGKAQRFNPEKVCGPPPTAYDPRFPNGGSGPASFPKGERFRDTHQGAFPESNLTRSHSSSSVGSSESAVSSKSQNKKEHSSCNRKINDLEKELRNMTFERNHLLKQKNTSHQPKEENINSEIQILNKTIQELQSRLDEAKALEDEKSCIENERDLAKADLDAKEKQISHLNERIEELKALYDEKEETLRTELEQAITVATTEKKELEAKLSEYELKIENLQNVRVELSGELESLKEAHNSKIENLNLKHEEDVQMLRAAHLEQVKELENNLQQMTAEYDAESEQMKFEHVRQIEELQQNHATVISRLHEQHSADLEQIRNSHEEEISKLRASYENLESDRNNLRTKFQETSLALETKLDEIATISAQLEVAKEKLDTTRIQAEERYQELKKTLELDIAECQAKSEEERKQSEEALRSHFEGELGLVSQSNQQLTEMLQMRLSELEELKSTHATSCAQYEEQIQRLNDNNQTEKEILIWQMSQQKENLELELRTEFENQMAEKNAELEQKVNHYDAQISQIHEDHANQIASMQANHAVEITQERQQHEIALDQLEKEKMKLVEERATLENSLREKESALETLSLKLAEVTNKLQLEIDVLRENNDQLVADLLRIEQEKQVSEERAETEKIELRIQLEENKSSLIASFEEKMELFNKESALKDKTIETLNTMIEDSERDAAERMAYKENQLKDTKEAYELKIKILVASHNEEVATLIQNFDRDLAEKDNFFAGEMEQLAVIHQQAMDEAKINHEMTVQRMQDELRATVESLERQWMTEREEMSVAHAQQIEHLEKAFQEKLEAVHMEYAKIIDELNSRIAMSVLNGEELQKKLEEVKSEFSEANAESDSKIKELRSEIATLTSSVVEKQEEIVQLNETIQKREMETADEWIQRETAIMSQVAAQNQQANLEFESRLHDVMSQLETATKNAERFKSERDAARDDISVFQAQMDAQLAALNEQYDQERSLMAARLSEQMREIEEVNAAKLKEAHSQISEIRQALEQSSANHARHLKEMEQKQEEAILDAVRSALEPIDIELEDLRKDREALFKIRLEYQELQARIEPFWEQLEMYEAEKKALLSQAQNAESSMASLASKYAQLLGHQNSKQKIHHLEKLKQDIFQLRKELAEKNLALEKEKKARQKADARVKELTGQKKYDPSEAFKVPETPSSSAQTAPVAAPSSSKPSRSRQSVTPSVQSSEKETTNQRRVPFRPQSSTGFFLAMDDIERTKAEMERERNERIEARRKASQNYDAFEIDFGNNMRRETFDVPPKLNITHNIADPSNKENSCIFPHDLSGISITDEVALKNSKSKTSTNGDRMTSTPLQLKHPKS